MLTRALVPIKQKEISNHTICPMYLYFAGEHMQRHTAVYALQNRRNGYDFGY